MPATKKGEVVVKAKSGRKSSSGAHTHPATRSYSTAHAATVKTEDQVGQGLPVCVGPAPAVERGDEYPEGEARASTLGVPPGSTSTDTTVDYTTVVRRRGRLTADKTRELSAGDRKPPARRKVHAEATVGAAESGKLSQTSPLIAPPMTHRVPAPPRMTLPPAGPFFLVRNDAGLRARPTISGTSGWTLTIHAPPSATTVPQRVPQRVTHNVMSPLAYPQLPTADPLSVPSLSYLAAAKKCKSAPKDFATPKKGGK